MRARNGLEQGSAKDRFFRVCFSVKGRFAGFCVYEFFRAGPGFRASFQIRARFRVQNQIFLRVEKTQFEKFRAGSPGPLPSPEIAMPEDSGA